MVAANLVFQAGSLGWLWLAAALLAIVGVAILYRYERRLVAARIGNALLALRMAAVAVLFFALMQPVIAVVSPAADQRRVLVAVDVSQSMHSADAHATSAEKLRWARALQTIGGAANDPRLDQWQRALDNGETLESVEDNHLRTVLADIGELRRLEIVDRLLFSTSTPLWSQLQEIADVRLLLFADRSLAAAGETINFMSPSVAEGLNLNVTDIAAGQTPADSGPSSQPPTAVVLFTDGRDTSIGDPLAAARDWGAAQVPVFPVMIGTPRPPVDIAVAKIDAPASVFLGDTPRITATLSTHGFAGREIDVELRPAGGSPLTQTVKVTGSVTEVQFDWPAAQAGRQTFSVFSPPLADELRDDNNTGELAITVVDDTVRALLIDQEARWEFRFIDNAFRRDNRVDVRQVVFEQPFLNVLDEPFFPKSLDWPADPAEWTTSPLVETDVVIVGDVSQRFMTPAAWETLERYVDEGGGALVLLAGKNYFDPTQPPPALERLLPVSDLVAVADEREASTASPVERGFHFRLTPEGEREPMLQFAADPQANREVWRDFPGHPWTLVGVAKPGATVLATMAEDNEAAPAPTDARALLVRQAYGLGQVLWLGVDSTWRWRHRAGDRYHHRFWGQLARWAAQHGSGGKEAVRFGPERSDINAGETATWRARFSRVFLERFLELAATVELAAVGDDGNPQSVTLQPAPGRPLAYEGQSPGLPPGEYRARLILQGADLDTENLTAKLFVAPPPPRELVDLSADESLLTQIAAVSGGQLLRPDEVHRLPELLDSAAAASADAEEIPLWCHPLTLAAFCLLLTAEWVIRKLNGLP